MLFDIQDLLRTSTSKPKISPLADFRRGVNWTLALLDLETSSMNASKEIQEFVSDFINRTKEDL